MIHQNAKKYIHVLSDIIKSYNHTQHQGLGGEHTPNQIHQLRDLQKIQDLFKKMYKIPSSSHKPFISTLNFGGYILLSQLVLNQHSKSLADFHFREYYYLNSYY